VQKVLNERKDRLANVWRQTKPSHRNECRCRSVITRRWLTHDVGASGVGGVGALAAGAAASGGAATGANLPRNASTAGVGSSIGVGAPGVGVAPAIGVGTSLGVGGGIHGRFC
jgi:hypothetical protein